MTDNTTDTRVLGSLRESDGRAVIHVEDTYPTDIDDLWSAVSTPERLKRWIATIEGDTSVGGTFSASFTSGWDGSGRVDVCDAPHRLVVTTFDNKETTVMEAILTPVESGTHLVIEERGILLEDAPYHGAGWQAHIEDLALYVAGKETTNWEDRWKELVPTYRGMKIG
ncbi:MAG TPA: SRPBCC family protein [Galbitalea sp.]|jgi:uncharacterized protein YndB with AHSA1/START domain